MNDREALIAGIVAAPDDDAPKLIYADWLEEREEESSALAIREIVKPGMKWSTSLNTARKVIRGMLACLPREAALYACWFRYGNDQSKILLLAYADCLEELEVDETIEVMAIRQFCGLGMGLSDREVNEGLAKAGLKCRLPRPDAFYTSLGPVGNYGRGRDDISRFDGG